LAGAFAAQLGVALAGGANQSPLLYVQLVQSQRILGAVVSTSFPNPDRPRFGATDSLPLLGLLDLPPERTPERQFDAGVRFLREKAVAVDVDLKTMLVTVSAQTQYPQLSQQVAQRIIDLVGSFNRDIRRSQARARREFAEQRATEYEQELAGAERDLEQFYVRNRSYRNSPELVSAETRLQRKVTVHQELFLNMSRETESARLEEVNTVPLLTVLDPPTVPVRRSFPKRILMALFGILAGLAIGLGRVLADPGLRYPLPSADAELKYLRDAWQQAKLEILAGLRLRRRKKA
jgi:uncharacterized protein involved in exopolysaccharide biosynthesis